MKTLKATKAEIKKILKSGNRTNIFKLAAKCGIDVSNKYRVHKFIQENAPSQQVYKSAYDIALYASNYKEFRWCITPRRKSPIQDAIRFAKQQAKKGWSNYNKKLFVGNDNIYWCHPSYAHEDYNKHRAFVNTPKYRKVAESINKFLGY